MTSSVPSGTEPVLSLQLGTMPVAATEPAPWRPGSRRCLARPKSYMVQASRGRKRQNMATKSRTASKPTAKRRATTKRLRFIESMECLPVAKLPEGPQWSYEIKLDGYRLEAIKEAKETRLYSRRANLLTAKFPYLAAALSKLPNGTILDGEVVALDARRRSDFNLLQNFRSAETTVALLTRIMFGGFARQCRSKARL